MGQLEGSTLNRQLVGAEIEVLETDRASASGLLPEWRIPVSLGDFVVPSPPFHREEYRIIGWSNGSKVLTDGETDEVEGNQYVAWAFTFEATFEIEYQVIVQEGPEEIAYVLTGDAFQILSESAGEDDFEAVSDTIATDMQDTSVTMKFDAGESRLVVENAAVLTEDA